MRLLPVYSQLQQSEEARETELTDLNQLTSEFTARISEAERKLNLATKVSVCGC